MPKVVREYAMFGERVEWGVTPEHVLRASCAEASPSIY